MSRLDEMIRQVEEGAPVDFRRVAILQALDVAKAGEDFINESDEMQREADEQLRQFIAAR